MTSMYVQTLANPIERRGFLLLAMGAALGRIRPAHGGSDADAVLGALLDSYVIYAFERDGVWTTVRLIGFGRTVRS
jgi:hypothetical protein